MALSIIEKLFSLLPQASSAPLEAGRVRADLQTLLADVHHNIGCVAQEGNDPAGALKHCQLFNSMMWDELGDKAQGRDIRLAKSWNELGNAYMLNKMWEMAEPCFLRSIATMKLVENLSKTDVSFMLVNLGLAYWLMDRLEEAVQVLQEGLQDRSDAFGKDDKDSFR